MKKIIIYTTNDQVLSLKLVNNIVSSNYLKDYYIDIILTNPNFFRKLKILIVMIFFGSLRNFFAHTRDKISIEKIIKEKKNCRIIRDLDSKDYNFGLSVYCSSKIQVEKFKIYNFHLGNLNYQRGSFIFFYKFIKNWNKVNLTFHEISNKFDVGKIINEREIKLRENCFASDIFFIYLKNLDFLIESIKKIDRTFTKEYKKFDKLNLVPSFPRLFKDIAVFLLQKNRS